VAVLGHCVGLSVRRGISGSHPQVNIRKTKEFMRNQHISSFHSYQSLLPAVDSPMWPSRPKAEAKSSKRHSKDSCSSFKVPAALRTNSLLNLVNFPAPDTLPYLVTCS
jgi:hypothetical protein